MKFIDEKGRIFGKVNIIDLLAVLLLLAAAVFLVQRKFFPAPAEDEPKSAEDVTYQVQVMRIEPVFHETVKQYVDRAEGKRDQMFSSDNNTFLDCYVVDCSAAPHVEYVTTSEGEVKRVESSGEDRRMDLIFTLEGKATDPNTNAIGNQQLRVGIGHYIKTTHFEFYGTIISVEKGSS